VRAHLRRLVRRIRVHWPKTLITIRGDSHYGRREAMDWCEQNGVRYIFGLGPNKTLAEQVFAKLDECCVRRAESKPDAKGKRLNVRDYTETTYGAKSWSRPRRVVARIEVTEKGADVRYVVTNLPYGDAEWLYDRLYCARGQAENLIKRHKSQLASDRTSCRSPLANQMRLILHTVAYWLMRTVRDAIPRPQALASGEFSTIRLRLLKVAVRIKETASRVRLSALTGTDPLLLMEVEPANAHEFVIRSASSPSLAPRAARVASMVRRRWLNARRFVGQKWQSQPAMVSLFG
jgi:hypothetical protein